MTTDPDLAIETCVDCKEAGEDFFECELCNKPLCPSCSDDGYFVTHQQTMIDPEEAVSLCKACMPVEDD